MLLYLQTALHIAAEHGHIENIKLLIEFNADLQIHDQNGNTPSDLAEQGGHDAACTELQKAAGNYTSKCSYISFFFVKLLMNPHPF